MRHDLIVISLYFKGDKMRGEQFWSFGANVVDSVSEVSASKWKKCFAN